MQETFSLNFKRPLVAVFTALTDFNRLKEMSQGKVVIEPVDGRPQTGPDSAVLFKSPQPGVGDVLVETTEWDEPNKVVRVFRLTDMPTTVTMDFKETDGGTRLDFTLELLPESAMFKMMMPLIQKKVADNKAEAIAKLQAQLDATA
jgi:uncharacterized protein YndB with AHSA1/START domain